MRTRKLSLFAFAAIAALATSCSNDELTDNTNQKGIVIEATAGTPQGGADTRLTHTPGIDKMSIVWAADDQFTACTSGGNYTDYTIKAEDAGKSSASFTASWSTAPSTGTIQALYPAIGSSVTPTAVTLSMDGQDGTYNGENGLKAFNYMTASTSYTGTGNLAFGVFSHQVAIVKLVLTFPSDVTGTATGIGLKATGLNISAVLNLTDGTFSGNTAGDVTTRANAIAIDGSNQLTAYLCVLPGSLTDAKAIATVGSDNYEAELSDLTIAAGNMYTATVTMTKKAAGIEWAAGNLVADGPNGAKIGTPTDKGLYFQFGSLVGWSTEDPLAVAVSPVGCTVTPWSNIWTGDPAAENVTTGTGDPCKYYLKGTWRLPEKDEYMALFNYVTAGSYANTGGWSWNDTDKFATNSTKNLTFPASGWRDNFDGSLYDVGTFGFYWSASLENGFGPYGHILGFSSSLVDPSTIRSRASGLPVRCVR